MKRGRVWLSITAPSAPLQTLTKFARCWFVDLNPKPWQAGSLNKAFHSKTFQLHPSSTQNLTPVFLVEIWTRLETGTGPVIRGHKPKLERQMAGHLELMLLSTSKLSSPVTGGLITYNPVIDLAATAGDGSSVLHIWRANDQLVCKHTERNQKVDAICWKKDGVCL
jgi:hypothetical protein